jgi:hypothetical protein
MHGAATRRQSCSSRRKTNVTNGAPSGDEIPNAQADRPLAAAVCSIDSLPIAGTRSLTQSAIDRPLIAVNVSRAGPRRSFESNLRVLDRFT